MTVTSNTIKFYLSTDATITTADIVLTGTLSVTALAAGASSAGSTTVTVPTTVPPGTYTVGACADATSTQPETIETNNCRAAPITVIRDVDLVMSAVSTTSTSVAVGGSFIINNTEKNQGTTWMSATSNVIRFYLSADATITSADKLLTGTRTVAALAPGASSSAATTVTVPSTIAKGTYYIGAIADATNAQPETNPAGTGETNNTNSPSAVRITVF